MASTETSTASVNLPEALSFIIGLGVSILASVMNAAGLNILKRDHVRNIQKTTAQRRNECGRPMWHLGLYLYVGSQIFGSTVALMFLKTQWVAPLGALALIFNFVFARMLVGTLITRKDIIGTGIIMVSVVLIVVLGTFTKGSGGLEAEKSMDLNSLYATYARPLFVVYFTIVDALAILLLLVAVYAQYVLQSQQRLQRYHWLSSRPVAKMKALLGILFAGVGGLIASETLLLGKSALSLISFTLGGHSQFIGAFPYVICGGLIITAVLQVGCLNTALKLADSVVVVPIFYGFYTAVGLVNTMVYLDQFDQYEWYILLLIIIAMGALCFGVKMLSQKKADPAQVIPPNSSSGPDSVADHLSIPMQDEPRSAAAVNGDSASSSSLYIPTSTVTVVQPFVNTETGEVEQVTVTADRSRLGNFVSNFAKRIKPRNDSTSSQANVLDHAKFNRDRGSISDTEDDAAPSASRSLPLQNSVRPLTIREHSNVDDEDSVDVSDSLPGAVAEDEPREHHSPHHS